MEDVDLRNLKMMINAHIVHFHCSEIKKLISEILIKKFNKRAYIK